MGALAALGAASAVAGVAVWLATGRPQSTDTLPSSVTVDNGPVIQGETEFFENLDEARNSLNGATRESVYLRSGDDLWQREIESLERDLDKVELNDRQLSK